MARSYADLHPTSCLDWSEEPADVRELCDLFFADALAKPAPRVIPARAYRPRKKTP